MQHGFLSGRSMLANIVDIQHAAQKTGLAYENGGIVLSDFKAAFPSLSHHYMQEVLRKLGMPAEALQMVRMFYHQHGCNINFGGEVFEGFDIQAGIRS